MPSSGETLALEEIQQRLTAVRKLHPAIVTLQRKSMMADAEPSLEKGERIWHQASVRDLWLLYLSQLKSTLLAQQRFDAALQIVELLLSLEPDDPYERRDRGYVLPQLNCYAQAAQDYHYFVEHCPDDPASEVIRQQIHQLQSQSQVLH